MTRPRHPKPEIEKAIQYAEQVGWSVELSSGHAWGTTLLSAEYPRWMHRQRMVDAQKPRESRSSNSKSGGSMSPR